MIELAVVGSLIIMMLGLLVQYGMNADFHQYGAMEAFRGALRMTGESLGPDLITKQETYRQSGSVLVVRDRHVPDPSHPFGVGSITPVSTSAQVTRSHQLHLMPSEEPDLPRTRMYLPRDTAATVEFNCGSAGRGCTNSGFRVEAVSTASRDRYNEIYGASNICWSQTCGATPAGCESWVQERDEETGEVVDICAVPLMSITIVDPCEGELISLEACRKQARMMTDPAYCQQECNRSDPAGNKNCFAICAQPMTMPLPWYAQGGNLDSLFAGGVEDMGLQPDTTTVTRTNHQLATTESPAAITTTASGGTSQDTIRTMVWSPMNAGGPRGQARDKDVKGTKDVKTENTWTANW